MNKIYSPKKGSFLITKLMRIISIRVASFLANYNVSPNQVTLVSFVFVLGAFFSFSVGQRFFNILGMVFFLIGFLLDLTDGDLARLKNQTSLYGEWLDSITGKIGTVLFFLGICIGQSRHKPSIIIWILGFVAISGFYVRQSLEFKSSILRYKRNLDYSKSHLNDVNMQLSLKKRNNFLRILFREIFCGTLFFLYVIIFAIIFDKLPIFLWIVAVHIWLDYFLQVYFVKGKIKTY